MDKTYQEKLEKALSSNHHFIFLIVPSRVLTLLEIISFTQKNKGGIISIFDEKQIDVLLAGEIQKISLRGGFEKKIIIVSFYSFLHEAQNKMLKTLEEVRGSTKFIFMSESKEGVLPTILSRAEVYDLTDGIIKKKHFDIKLFLQTNHTLRAELPFVKAMLSKKDSGDKKDREYFVHFLSELLEELSSKKEGIEIKKEVLMLSNYARDVSGSSKMIFDYLALRLPIVLE